MCLLSLSKNSSLKMFYFGLLQFATRACPGPPSQHCCPCLVEAASVIDAECSSIKIGEK